MPIQQYLEISGSPFEQGIQHGEAFRKMVKELADIRLEIFQKETQFTREKTIKIASKEIQILSKHKDLESTEFFGVKNRFPYLLI